MKIIITAFILGILLLLPLPFIEPFLQQHALGGIVYFLTAITLATLSLSLIFKAQRQQQKLLVSTVVITLLSLFSLLWNGLLLIVYYLPK